jgi:endo-1,4-beta-xylanase
MQDSTYASLHSNQYNLVTAENGCKWAAVQPQRGKFDFTQCDYILNHAKASGQVFRAHNLCWGMYNPNWLANGGFTPAQKRTILEDYITTVVKRYNSTPIAWDVVNEAVADSGTDLFKNNVWYPDIPDYVDFAFRTARAANPTVKLFYNDYNIASSTGWSATKSQKVYDMVKSMKQRGVPIDGVGFQLHVDLTYGSMIQGVVQNLARFAGLGVEVHMTEVDVSCSPYGQNCPSWTPDKEQTQAQIYAGLIQACLGQPKCTNFETWGFTDKYSWLGVGNHPLPFDENYRPKPAFNSLLQSLMNSTTTIIN